MPTYQPNKGPMFKVPCALGWTQQTKMIDLQAFLYQGLPDENIILWNLLNRSQTIYKLTLLNKPVAGP